MDFFQSLCNIPPGILFEYWYVDEKGNTSKYVSPFDYHDWQENQFRKYSKMLCMKSLDWKTENEYRLLLPDLINSYSDKNERKFKYRFEDLEGIIFGNKIRNKDKMQIIKIVEEKCKKRGRKDFDFFQVEFDSRGSITIDKLDLIKVE